MVSKSKIEWTESTWNPVTGCTKLSLGCKNCYAERMSFRLMKMGQRNYKKGFDVTIHEHMLSRPLEWKKPQIIFVNSMSDLFHEEIPAEFIMKVVDIMEKTYWHTFQVLTKRTERLTKMKYQINWPKNVWVGTTIEHSDYTYRIEHLNQINAAVKYLSLEPLLSSIPKINLTKINWVIVGGESGPKARLIKKEWVEEIQTQCAKADVPFFFKQWGGTGLAYKLLL